MFRHFQLLCGVKSKSLACRNVLKTCPSAVKKAIATWSLLARQYMGVEGLGGIHT